MAITVTGLNRVTINSIEVVCASTGTGDITLTASELDTAVNSLGTTEQKALWEASKARLVMSQQFGTSAAATACAEQYFNLTRVNANAAVNATVLGSTFAGGGPYTPAVYVYFADTDEQWVRIRVNPSQVK